LVNESHDQNDRTCEYENDKLEDTATNLFPDSAVKLYNSGDPLSDEPDLEKAVSPSKEEYNDFELNRILASTDIE
jgi:hypothetical protein